MSISNRNDGLGLAGALDTAGLVGGEGNVSATVKIPDPETPSLPKRRRFSADYKARIVEEAEACTKAGDIGALVRREGLYSSQLSQWRKQYRAGALRALHDDKRGRKVTKHPLEEENEKLRSRNASLSHRLERAEAIIEIQKKMAAMLGIPPNGVENDEAK